MFGLGESGIKSKKSTVIGGLIGAIIGAFLGILAYNGQWLGWRNRIVATTFNTLFKVYKINLNNVPIWYLGNQTSYSIE